jgi:hypothetical protein
MSASIQSSRDLLITFERDGTVTDRQVSAGGFDAVTTALTSDVFRLPLEE